MTKRIQFNLIVASVVTITAGGLGYLFYETHISVKNSQAYNETARLSYISEMATNTDNSFSTDSDLKDEQLADLERCWDEYSTYPDGIVKAGWSNHPDEERQIQVISTNSGYTNVYTSHFVYGDGWNTHYFIRNALATSSLIIGLLWTLISAVGFAVINVKYAKPKEIARGEAI